MLLMKNIWSSVHKYFRSYTARREEVILFDLKLSQTLQNLHRGCSQIEQQGKTLAGFT